MISYAAIAGGSLFSATTAHMARPPFPVHRGVPPSLGGPPRWKERRSAPNVCDFHHPLERWRWYTPHDWWSIEVLCPICHRIHHKQ